MVKSVPTALDGFLKFPASKEDKASSNYKVAAVNEL